MVVFLLCLNKLLTLILCALEFLLFSYYIFIFSYFYVHTMTFLNTYFNYVSYKCLTIFNFQYVEVLKQE